MHAVRAPTALSSSPRIAATGPGPSFSMGWARRPRCSSASRRWRSSAARPTWCAIRAAMRSSSYTEDGNYDLVGNGTPVFFIRDPQKFPDFIHSQKRDPFTNMQEPDNAWDFFSHSPEATHQFTWLFGDRGIPASYRNLDGFGSHTFQWTNARGEIFWVKYHFKTDQGIKNLTSQEAAAISATNPDHHHQDLLHSIETGQFPSWTVKVQIMPAAEAASYRFNPFDLTKGWYYKDYPLITIGKLTLHRNPH